jgi:hypothetical protein
MTGRPGLLEEPIVPPLYSLSREPRQRGDTKWENLPKKIAPCASRRGQACCAASGARAAPVSLRYEIEEFLAPSARRPEAAAGHRPARAPRVIDLRGSLPWPLLRYAPSPVVRPGGFVRRQECPLPYSWMVSVTVHLNISKHSVLPQIFFLHLSSFGPGSRLGDRGRGNVTPPRHPTRLTRCSAARSFQCPF